MNRRLAFIGCGKMGEAILKGILEKGLFTRSCIVAADPNAKRKKYLKRRYGVNVTGSVEKATDRSDIVILAVKPQDMALVLNRLKDVLKNRLVISIAAGITIDYIRKIAGANRVIRVMPNTPALVGCGMTAVSASPEVNSQDLKMADRLFMCVGKILHLKEKHLDAVTAVSGSGPAYFFLLMEAMIDAAVSCGLERQTAQALTLQTALGASILQNKTNVKPSILRKEVTSKGGTTQEAIRVFRRNGFERIVRDGIKAARNRARQLAR